MGIPWLVFAGIAKRESILDPRYASTDGRKAGFMGLTEA